MVCKLDRIGLFENYISVLIPKEGRIHAGYQNTTNTQSSLLLNLSLTPAVIAGNQVRRVMQGS